MYFHAKKKQIRYLGSTHLNTLFFIKENWTYFVMYWLCVNIILLILIYGVLSNDDKNCQNDECGILDPRRSYTVDTNNYINPVVNITDLYIEITQGNGFVIIPQAFSLEDIKHARQVIQYLLKTQGQKATHFQGSVDAKPELQARVWNLLNKGTIWEKMVQHPVVMKIASLILGDDFQLGSIASNSLFPGGSGQEPHIDYPYWDYYNNKHWPVPPKHRDIPFYMNMQVTVLLDDFTKENGATAVRPKSQLDSNYPSDVEDFYKNMIQTTGHSGDIIIFVGLLQHCAMPNKSNMPRTGVLLQYLPKYIRPMEDIKRGVSRDVLKRATGTLRNLLLLDYPYPSVLDDAESTNSEGYASEFSWKNTD